MAKKPSSIFINPKFRNAHINPNFLQPNNKIHVNPKFLTQHKNFAVAEPEPDEAVLIRPIVQHEAPPNVNSNAIIRNTRRTLIRVPAPRSFDHFSETKKVENKTQQQQLIKISKNKLVTAAHLMKVQQKENEIIKSTTESIIKTKEFQRKTVTKDSIYKLDRRASKSKIVSKYSIRRVDSISPKKVIVSDRKLLKIGQTPSKSSSSNIKSLVMLNINGVLYKSTTRKLEKTSSVDNILIIRGEKFVLDTSGRKLQREDGNSSLKMSRIDIGGLTYKASESGAFERDNSHQVRSHLSLAKTKSISFLARSITKKSNLICPIYRRIGKCLSYANGRCYKLHDQRYVIVCPKFLKGLCSDDKCLLSHNANLHKMPVCKFFLQGLCQKQRECLYLHKKLTDNTKLCAEFIKGYCPKAAKCNLLHDFPQLHQRDKKKFSIILNQTPSNEHKHVNIEDECTQPAENTRYYIDSEQLTNGSVPKRGVLGKLPSYIPL